PAPAAARCGWSRATGGSPARGHHRRPARRRPGAWRSRSPAAAGDSTGWTQPSTDQVVANGEQRDGGEQREANPDGDLTLAWRERPAAHPLDDEEEEHATVEQRHRKQVEQSQ